ncbi:phage integrase N-terminal SAM-like domain-containing protein [Microcoleus sp. N3A4]|uniref:phage integrase N-terminal SAM-like domain-containing protein n=1 Tax=Microcoleus sp. N3A4 TaxID=3055379 RepID=UPI00403F25E5
MKASPGRAGCLSHKNCWRCLLIPINLLNQVRQTLRLKHISRSTENIYLHSILDYIYFHKKRHP